jgi:hypothetical protein
MQNHSSEEITGMKQFVRLSTLNQRRLRLECGRYALFLRNKSDMNPISERNFEFHRKQIIAGSNAQSEKEQYAPTTITFAKIF